MVFAAVTASVILLAGYNVDVIHDNVLCTCWNWYARLNQDRDLETNLQFLAWKVNNDLNDTIWHKQGL
jgi:hypothetical protein